MLLFHVLNIEVNPLHVSERPEVKIDTLGEVQKDVVARSIPSGQKEATSQTGPIELAPPVSVSTPQRQTFNHDGSNGCAWRQER